MPRADSAKRESWVETYLLNECTRHGALCVKIKALRGWPDRLIYWWEGVHDLVETKRPVGGRFEPLQTRVHAKLGQRGHSVFVINSREQVDAYIESREHAFRLSQRLEITRDAKSKRQHS